jgi:hypothetical protein
MTTLIWKAPMQYYSDGNESAFFLWLESIKGVMSGVSAAAAVAAGMVAALGGGHG